MTTFAMISGPSTAYWRITLLSVAAAATLALTACADMTPREKSVAVGAGVGAVVGGVVTGGSPTGAAVGAVAGGVVGNEVDKKKNR